VHAFSTLELIGKHRPFEKNAHESQWHDTPQHGSPVGVAIATLLSNAHFEPMIGNPAARSS
jgi:hypothetical protein